MTELSALHGQIHPFVMSEAGGFMDHLLVSTLVAGALLTASALLSEPRLRRASAIAALLVFLAPVPDLLPERGLLDLDVSGVAFVSNGPTSSTARAPDVQALDPLCLALLVWIGVSLLAMARLTLRLLAPTSAGRPVPPGLKHRIDVPDTTDVRLVTDVSGPRVAGVIRPVILIPERLIEETDEEELRAVLIHELSHIRQRDNLWNAVSALVTSMFWFHPLTWIGSLRYRAASELVCDAAVIDAGVPRQTYLRSLMKLVSLSPVHQPADTAFGGGSLVERIRIMNKTASKLTKNAVRLSIAAIVLLSLAAALSLKALVGGGSIDSMRSASSDVSAYRFEHQVSPMPDGTLRADFAVIDLSANRLLAIPRVDFLSGTEATLRVGNVGPDGAEEMIAIDVNPAETEDRILATLAIDRPNEAFRKTYEIAISRPEEINRSIDLSLQGADLTETLDLFATLGQAELIAAADLTGMTVSITLSDTPWNEALDDVLEDHGLHWRRIGGLLVVFGEKD